VVWLDGYFSIMHLSRLCSLPPTQMIVGITWGIRAIDLVLMQIRGEFDHLKPYEVAHAR